MLILHLFMKADKFLKSCPNSDCKYYKKKMRGNIVSHGVASNGTKRFKCKSCGKTFAKTRNTFYFYRHMSKEEIKVMCKLLSKKMSFRGIARQTNHHLDTVRNLFHHIHENYDRMKEYFVKELDMSADELKAMSEHLKKKKSKKTFKN